MNIAQMAPVIAAAPLPGQPQQHSFDNNDFLLQLMQGQTVATVDPTAAESSYLNAGNVRPVLPGAAESLTENTVTGVVVPDQAVVPSIAPVSAEVSRTTATAVLNELYPQQWLATGHLSYLAQSIDANTVPSTTLVSRTTPPSVGDDGPSAVHTYGGTVKPFASNTLAAGMTAAMVRDHATVEQDAAEDWQQHLTQVINETSQPWLRRRLSVQFGTESAHILIRDFNATEADTLQLVGDLLQRIQDRMPTTIRITVNGRDLTDLVKAAPSFTEKHHAR